MGKRFKPSAMLASILVLALALSGSAAAMENGKNGRDDSQRIKEKVLALEERGILPRNGKSYLGKGKLTFAEGIPLIVRGLELGLDEEASEAPLASEYFDHVADDAWYAKEFVIAAVHELGLPKDVNPNAHMTREQFAHYVMIGLRLKGEFPFTMKWFVIADEAEIDPDFRDSIQLLLNGRLMELDKDGYFHPKQAITKRDAAVLIYDVIAFVKRYTVPDGNTGNGEVSYRLEKVNEEVNRLILSWGEKPNPGYGIRIAQIVFVDGNTAEIHYELHYPDPDRFYPQVIVTPTDTTYLASRYDRILLRPVTGSKPQEEHSRQGE